MKNAGVLSRFASLFLIREGLIMPERGNERGTSVDVPCLMAGIQPCRPLAGSQDGAPSPPSPSVLRPFRPFSWTLRWRISRIVLTSIPLFMDHIQTLWTVWSFNHEILHHICAIGKLLDLDCIIFASVLRSISRLASKLSTQVMKSCLTVCLYSLISSSLQSFLFSW